MDQGGWILNNSLTTNNFSSVILSWMNSVHIVTPYFSKRHIYIILPSMHRFPEWSLPFNFFDKNFIFMSHPSHNSPAQPTWSSMNWSPKFYFVNSTNYEVLQYAFLFILLTSSVLCINTLLRTIS